MRFTNPALDRAWLWAIGVSFTVMLPIWLILWAERFGWVNMALGVFALFLIGLYRGWPID